MPDHTAALLTRMDTRDVFIEGVVNEHGQIVYRAHHRPTGIKTMLQGASHQFTAEHFSHNRHTLLRGLEQRIAEKARGAQ